MNVPTIKPEPIRPRLAQPLNPEGRCLGSTLGRAVLRDQPPRKYIPPNIANGARLLVGPLPRTKPLSVTGSTRNVSS